MGRTYNGQINVKGTSIYRVWFEWQMWQDYLKGYSIPEISKRTGYVENTVKENLRRYKSMLKRHGELDFNGFLKRRKQRFIDAGMEPLKDDN